MTQKKVYDKEFKIQVVKPSGTSILSWHSLSTIVNYHCLHLYTVFLILVYNVLGIWGIKKRCSSSLSVLFGACQFITKKLGTDAIS